MTKAYSLILYVGLFLFSCGADDEIPTPSYLSIQPFEFVTKTNEGTARQRIIDGWVYVNGEYVGAYELPATIPVIFEGKCEIQIFPGYRKDGKINAPNIYPLGNIYKDSILLVQKDTLTIKPITGYVDGILVPFNEDFEGFHFFNRDLDNNAQTKITLSSAQDAFEGTSSGEIILDSVNNWLAAEFDIAEIIPAGDIQTLVELHFKADMSFSIGFLGYRNGEVNANLISATLIPKEEWTKVYFGFRELLNDEPSSEYRIAIAARYDPKIPKSQQRILIDNFKVVYK
jgi:hypothetical protein